MISSLEARLINDDEPAIYKVVAATGVDITWVTDAPMEAVGN